MGYESIKTMVSAADLVRHFGEWQQRAGHEPIHVTQHGHERLVMLSKPSYNQLVERAARGDRHAAQPDMLRLGVVLERIRQGFVAVDRRLVIVDLNPAACSCLRIGRDAAIGTGLSEAFPEVERTALYGHLVHTIHSGEIAAFDQRSFTFEGRWLHVETLPHLDGAAFLFRDITTEREQRFEAQNRAATCAAMGAHAGVGTASVNVRGRITGIDKQLAAMAGLEPGALAGARFTDILPLPQRREATERIEAVLSGGEPISFATALLVNRGGECPIRVGVAELRGDHGGEGAVIVVTPA